MDLTQQQQDQRIERYILKKMCDEEATEFEIEYLADEACIEQLEMAEKLYLGLNMISSTSDTSETSKHQTANQMPNQIKIKAPVWWQKNVPLWSIAATVLVMLMPLRFMMDPQTISSLPSSSLPSSSSSNIAISVITIEMAEFRGGQNKTLTIPGVNQQLILSAYIDTEREDMVFPAYDFTLFNQTDNTPVITLSDITLNQDAMLYFNLGTNQIHSGQFNYLITGKTTKGEYITLKEGELNITNQP